MKRTVTLVRWIGSLAGLLALILGLLYWIVGINLITIHMLSGLTVALALLVLSMLWLFAQGMRWQGAVGVVYAFILPAFGMTQAGMLIGPLHWLIRTLHLLVGIGALAYIGIFSVRYLNLKRVDQSGPESSTQQAAD